MQKNNAFKNSNKEMCMDVQSHSINTIQHKKGKTMQCQQKGCPQAPRNGSDTTELYSSGCHRPPFDLPLVQHRDTTLRLFALVLFGQTASLASSPRSVAVVHEAHWGQVMLGR